MTKNDNSSNTQSSKQDTSNSINNQTEQNTVRDEISSAKNKTKTKSLPLNLIMKKIKTRLKQLRQTNSNNDLSTKIIHQLTDKTNICIALSALSIALSIYAVNSSSLSKAKLFLEDNGATSTVTTQLTSPTASNQSNNTSTQHVDENDTFMKFTNELEFKQAVSKAIYQIRKDEAEALMQVKFSKYENAQNSVPNSKRIYGNPQARFILQEFSDIECPYCKNFFNTPKEVADLSNGQVAVEWIHTPLSFHEPAATQEAIATECVLEQKGNRAFWVSVQHLFDTTQGNGRGSQALGRIVSDFNLDKDKYIDCINSQKTFDKIDAHKQLAVKAGVTGTPALLITDTQTGRTKLLGGAQPKEIIMQAIEDLNSLSTKETIVEE